MDRKKGIFILGIVVGILTMVFLTGLRRAINGPKDVSVLKLIDGSVEMASPSVVGIVNLKEEKERSTGSGVIYKLTNDTAYIVTNYHVIKGADAVEVAFKDEGRVKAEIIGEDILTDLAVVKIPRGEIARALPFAKEHTLTTGDIVLAIGNPLGLDLYGSITMGIVSSHERLVPVDVDKNGENDFIATVIQTDAAINPGNSGGALVNLEGELVGINSMKVAGTQIEGIGFSIPVHVVRKVIYDLETHQKVIRPYLGLHIKSISKISEEDKKTYGLEAIEEGVYVNDVVLDSSSSLAGLEVNDVITHVEGEKVKDVTDFRYKLYRYKVGDEIALTILRQNESFDVTVNLKSR